MYPYSKYQLDLSFHSDFEFTKESLLKFKKDLEKREEAAKQAQSGGEGFGGFGGFGGGDDQKEEEQSDEKEMEQEGAEETVRE